MYKININKECGCFKKSDYENNMTFSSKDDALMQSNLMVNHMNNKFCGKHEFTLVENGDIFQINMQEEAKPHSGCCGGGHCS
ncbi:hypothetical protein MNB_ARC-1_1314 [hydrothermal vent metagenome]|uniref:Uncharacterized protein n=1 Tax=hydrothermal vent metagenome TaxID=652676 RepID=A0A3B1DU17_9ZZZZ